MFFTYCLKYCQKQNATVTAGISYKLIVFSVIFLTKKETSNGYLYLFYVKTTENNCTHYSFHSFGCFCLSQQCNGSNVVEGMKAPAPLFATQYKTMTPWHIHHVVKMFLKLYCCTSLLTSSIHKPLFPLVLTSD